MAGQTITLVKLILSREDVGQILDGLRVRQESWQHTADHVDECGEWQGVMDDDKIMEECNGHDEAQSIASHYAEIIRRIEEQM